MSQVDKIQNYYRFQAKIYDSTRWLFLFGRKRIVRWACASFKETPRSLLEVGCGTGYNLSRLAKSFPASDITGLDASPDMLEKARQNMGDRGGQIHFLKGDFIKATQGQPQTYDLILFSYCLTMVNPGWESMILHAKSLLGPQGRIAVVDFHDSKLPWFKAHMGRNHVRMDSHLLPFLKTQFSQHQCSVRAAYFGLWSYFMFVGR